MARSAGCKLFVALGNMDKPDMIAADFVEWTQDGQSRDNFLAEVTSVVEPKRAGRSLPMVLSWLSQGKIL